MGTNHTKWTKEGNVYKSGNLSTSNRTYLFHSITLEKAETLSFEVAVSQSENYEIVFLLFPPDFSNPIEQKSIKATPGITNRRDTTFKSRRPHNKRTSQKNRFINTNKRRTNQKK